MKEERGGWGKLYEYNVELRDLCYSSSAILVIKLRKDEWGECDMHGNAEKCVQGYGRETLWKEATWNA